MWEGTSRVTEGQRNQIQSLDCSAFYFFLLLQITRHNNEYGRSQLEIQPKVSVTYLAIIYFILFFKVLFEKERVGQRERESTEADFSIIISQ